ncbi:hypothetical protein HQ38_09695 [Porphyromonas crevioricanis]|uniref:Uncharacterized protein n=1 Tax=Porphyromonas crevioricanis TaxID=393921 RepID=A0AB34PDU0_9PORP|nr:hypothetical protein HQ38_09695 [Porphyromonas crevioricanis]GAD07150.1 hypothetical protein PORCAN_767 [Porphyromonas crevioricanis JCM 13913]
MQNKPAIPSFSFENSCNKKAAKINRHCPYQRFLFFLKSVDPKVLGPSLKPNSFSFEIIIYL